MSEVLLEYLHAQKFRNLLLESHKGSSAHKRTVTDVTRLIAAYFLDFPLFLPKLGESYPSLFVWCELKKEAFHPSTVFLDRQNVSVQLSPEFSPKSAAVMLVHLGLCLEAILYADYFNDHRSAFVLRIYADCAYGFSLVNDHCFNLIHEQIPAEVSRIVTSSNNKKGDVDRFCPAITKSILELDIVLNSTRIFSLEAFILGKMEFIFAQLGVSCEGEEVKKLPRPPVYLLPNLDSNRQIDSPEHLDIHIYVQMLLHSLHQSNRLQHEMNQMLAILAQFDTQFQPRMLSSIGSARAVSITQSSKLLRVLLLVLRMIYRERFSQAVAEQWEELPLEAAKYKALLTENENETDIKAFERWFSLETDGDLQNISLFIQYVNETFPVRSTLPSFCGATREIWMEHLMENNRMDSGRNVEGDWLSGHIRHDTKVDVLHYRQMAYLATHWSPLPLVDRSLISMLLCIHPSDLCTSKPDNTRRVSASSVGEYVMHLSPRATPSPRQSISAVNRYSVYADQQPGPSRPHRDLISEYARRGEKLFGKTTVARRENPVPPSRVEMSRRMMDRLRRVSETQREIASQLEHERSFIDSQGPFSERPRASVSSPNTSFNASFQEDHVRLSDVTAFLKTTVRREDVKRKMRQSINGDLSRLTEKLEEFSKIFHSRDQSSLGESIESFSTDGRTQSDLEIPEPEELEDVDEAPEEEVHFNYGDMVVATAELPPIEKLDFSQLSPPPTVGRRKNPEAFTPKGPSSARSIQSTTSSSSSKLQTDKKKKLRRPDWDQLLPLDQPTSMRDPIHKAQLPRMSKTERASQTSPHFTKQSLSRPDSGFDSGPTLKKLDFVREMSQENVQNLLNSVK